MILERGDMWSVFGKTDLFLITTNPIVRKDGALVMGRGIAKQAAARFPKLPFDFADSLDYVQTITGERNYCYFGSTQGERLQSMGYFMVKDHWREQAKPEIISQSVQDLHWLLKTYPMERVDLNFPGIGNGKLKREDVLPLIEKLPDNVHVWEYEQRH